jgi:hypothetical protein
MTASTARQPDPDHGSTGELSKALLQVLADDRLIDEIAAGRIPRQRDGRMAEVLAQTRASLLAGEINLASMDPPSYVPDGAITVKEDNPRAVDDAG